MATQGLYQTLGKTEVVFSSLFQQPCNSKTTALRPQLTVVVVRHQSSQVSKNQNKTKLITEVNNRDPRFTSGVSP
jgi:hypothetical protein